MTAHQLLLQPTPASDPSIRPNDGPSNRLTDSRWLARAGHNCELCTTSEFRQPTLKPGLSSELIAQGACVRAPALSTYLAGETSQPATLNDLGISRAPGLCR